MPRMPKSVLLAAGLVGSAFAATGALAIANPGDVKVLTNALLPLTGSAGTGDVTLQVDPYARKVCYAVNAKQLAAPMSGALVKGSTPIVTFKNAPRTNALDGCVDIDQKVAQDIVANPTQYAVSINNGALQGTLSPVRNFQ